MDKKLTQLIEKLKAAHGKKLVSVILYGSAAAGDAHRQYSDLNVFCVLEELTGKELAASEPIFRWWREQGHPSPLLMERAEVAASTDCFPIEFHDMSERREVLYGEDPIAGLLIDYAFYRAQVEHELRAKLLRLRQKAAGVLSNNELLTRLMLESVSTFCVLARHAVRLAGREAPWAKRAIAAAMAETFGIEPRTFTMLLDLREGKPHPRNFEPAAVFEQYLKEIGALVDAVDRLER